MALYSGKSTNNNREWDNHRDDREEAASLLQDDDEPNNRNHSTRNHHRDGIIKRCFSFLFNGILSFIGIDHNSPIIIQMKSYNNILRKYSFIILFWNFAIFFPLMLFVFRE